MFTSILDKLLRLLPSSLCERIGWKFVRSARRDWKVFSDLFVEPYSSWINWKSGLLESAYLLYSLVRATKPKVVVEIGTSMGRSACIMALACRQNGGGKVYAIDPHTTNDWTDARTSGATLRFVTERLRDFGLTDRCELIVATSEEAAAKWNQPIDILFIDGDHSYEGVKRDFELFRPWLGPRSTVLFHDTRWRYNHEWGWGDFYPANMGVPEYLQSLKDSGYQSVTLPVQFGLTLLDPIPGGFRFVPLADKAAPVA